MRPILLKGASFAAWYPVDQQRSYVDVDVLVAPMQLETAELELARRGFRAAVPQPVDPEPHAITWTRGELEPDIDLHRTLAGARADPERVWASLTARTDVLSIGGVEVETLAEPSRCLHVALHVAQGRGATHAPRDLERALRLAASDSWLEAARIADQIDATAAFAAGLRRTEAGRALATALELPPTTDVGLVLQAWLAPPSALAIARAADLHGWRARGRWFIRKLVPPAAVMRDLSPLAARGAVGLAAAYSVRIGRVIVGAPAALAVWSRARRSVRAVAAGTDRPEGPPRYRSRSRGRAR